MNGNSRKWERQIGSRVKKMRRRGKWQAGSSGRVPLTLSILPSNIHTAHFKLIPEINNEFIVKDPWETSYIRENRVKMVFILTSLLLLTLASNKAVAKSVTATTKCTSCLKRIHPWYGITTRVTQTINYWLRLHRTPAKYT